MFINPAEAVKNGWIKGLTNPEKQLQPNGIDFTLDILKEVNYNDVARISESHKSMRALLDVQMFGPEWVLRGGTVYDGTSNVYIEVPEGVAAILYTRSTFVRNGVFIVSGIFDSGYKGHIGFTIYPIGGQTLVEPGTRIGQVAFIKADSAGLYAGSYNHDAGTHYAESPPKALGDSTPGPGVKTKKKPKGSHVQTLPETDVGVSSIAAIAPVVPAVYIKEESQEGNEYVDPPIGAASPRFTQGTNMGQRQIQSDPRRTETGMGPLLGNNSDFI